MNPMRASRKTIGLSSAPFLIRPRTSSSRKKTTMNATMPSGIQSHHMGGRLPTRGQEDARCDECGQHDCEQKPADHGSLWDGRGGDRVQVCEEHADQSSGWSYG